MRSAVLWLAACAALGCGTATESTFVIGETGVALDRVLQSAIDAGGVPGAVAVVVNRDSVLYVGAAGVMDADGAQAMHPEAIFRIASMTKPITSLGILMLWEEGLLSLDDPASEYLPELAGREVLLSVDSANASIETRPASRAITIRDLLRHTSGVGYSFSNLELLEVSNATSIPAREQPILHDPGARWTYGMGTAFLGWIIEEVSGQSLPDFFASRITGPLGMDDTSFDLQPADQERLVAMYIRGEDGLAGQAPADFVPEVRGDGGLLSTASDYGRFIQVVLGGGARGATRLVQESSMFEMTRNQLEGITVVEQPAAIPGVSKAFPLGADRDGFGLGFQVSVGASEGGRPPGSLSWGGIANTHFWIDPVNEIGVVLLLQLLPFYDERAIELLTNFERTLYVDR